MKAVDKILNFLKFSGPSLAMRIAKNIEQDSIIASAYLSELVEQRKIKISNLKIGTSPLYYLPGQEDQLIKFTSEINPKDLDVLERLKKEKVIREEGQELLTKVALRNLKDFAMPLQVNINGNREIFWKFYMTGDEEVNQTISNIMGLSAPAEEPVPEEADVEGTTEKPAVIEEITPVESKEVVPDKPTTTYPPDTTKKIEEEKKADTYPPNTSEKVNVEEASPEYPPKTVEELKVEVKKESSEPEKEVKEDPKEEITQIEEKAEDPVVEEAKEEPNNIDEEEKEVIEEPEHTKEKTIEEEAKEEVQIELSEVTSEEEKEVKNDKEADLKVKEEPKAEKEETEKPVKEEKPKDEEPVRVEQLTVEETTESKDSEPAQEQKKEEKKSIVSKIKEKIVGKKKKKGTADQFLPILESYFKELDINIENMETVRKNFEINFHIKVPSVVGRLTYYCKAKKKKRCDEKDISAAYMEAQMKKIPLLFLYSDSLTKKAEEMLESEAFDNLIVKKIEE